MPVETLEAYLQPVWDGKQVHMPIQWENTAGQLEKSLKGTSKASP